MGCVHMVVWSVRRDRGLCPYGGVVSEERQWVVSIWWCGQCGETVGCVDLKTVG